MSETKAQEGAALLRILRVTRGLAGQATLAAAVVGAAALLGGANLPPELAGFVGGVGYNAIYDLLRRLARGDDMPDDAIRQQVLDALADVRLEQAQADADTQRMIGRLFHRANLLEHALRHGQLDILDALAQQTAHYDILRADLTQQLQSLATRQQSEEILAKLDRVLAAPQRPAAPMQLPARHTHFRGRQGDIDWVLRRLQPGRVVTLVGPGGMGKSVLAAEVIWRLAPAGIPPTLFPDGVIYYNFYSPYNQAALALEHIARAYGEEPRPTSADAARRALAGRTALLVLDGAEQADDLPAVLDVRGGCGVLITSRRHSDAAGEVRDLRLLATPVAVDLLRAWGGARVGADEVARQICDFVEGLPLAVRLAGS
jgi:hypothetical protein